MDMKKTIIALGIILALGLAAAGGFWGGMQYQSQRAERVAADFFANRPMGPNGQAPDQEFSFPQGGQPDSGFAGGMRGGTIGVIKSIDGNVITLSTAQDFTTITLSDTSQVNQTVSVPVTDLQPGMRISVVRQSDSEGKIEANVITILPTDSAQNP